MPLHAKVPLAADRHVFWLNLHTPVGWLELAGGETSLEAVYFRETDPGHSPKIPAHLEMAAKQLLEYFAGNRREFDLPLQAAGTDFQLRVWNVLRSISFGQTRSYLDVALAIQNPKAVRAVGGANGRNPISIIVPCHRVIGADGSMTGFGGKIWRKKWLLEHERGLVYGKQAQLF